MSDPLAAQHLPWDTISTTPASDVDELNSDSDLEGASDSKIGDNRKRAGEELAPPTKKRRRQKRKSALCREESAINSHPAPTKARKKKQSKPTTAGPSMSRTPAPTVNSPRHAMLGVLATTGVVSEQQLRKTAMEAHVAANMPLEGFPLLPPFGEEAYLKSALTVPTEGNSGGAASGGHRYLEAYAWDIVSRFGGLTEGEKTKLVFYFSKNAVLRRITCQLCLDTQLIGAPRSVDEPTLANVFRRVVYALVQDKQLPEAGSYFIPAFKPLLEWLKQEFVIGRIA